VCVLPSSIRIGMAATSDRLGTVSRSMIPASMSGISSATLRSWSQAIR
jgi:hypothetical protein